MSFQDFSRPSSQSPHPSLPARPPPPVSSQSSFKPSSGEKSKNGLGGSGNAYAAFKPRSVGSAANNFRSSNVKAERSSYPASNDDSSSNYAQQSYYGQPMQYQGISQNYPQLVPSGTSGASNRGDYDPEYEAQVAQWQSYYVKQDEASKQNQNRGAGNANNIPLGTRNGVGTSSEGVAGNSSASLNATTMTDNGKTVMRSGGGQKWQDSSLLEWDPAHYRIFVGNLAGEVTDESLLKAFNKYPSVQKARVVRDKKTTKSRGYGFVSFSSGDDYFAAAREMNGKYIGSHPVLIKRSTTEIKATNPHDKRKSNKNQKHRASGGGQGANTGAGVKKNQAQSKNGLRMIG